MRNQWAILSFNYCPILCKFAYRFGAAVYLNYSAVLQRYYGQYFFPVTTMSGFSRTVSDFDSFKSLGRMGPVIINSMPVKQTVFSIEVISFYYQARSVLIH